MVNDVVPEIDAACCNVLIVSNGANNNFEQPAASPLSKLFLKPLTHGASWDLLGEVAEAYRIVLVFVFLLLLTRRPRRC